VGGSTAASIRRINTQPRPIAVPAAAGGYTGKYHGHRTTDQGRLLTEAGIEFEAPDGVRLQRPG